MIFDGEPRRSSSGSTLKRQEISIQLPAKDGQSPLPAPSAAPAAPIVEPPTPPIATKVAPEVIAPKALPAAAPPVAEKSAVVEKAPPAVAAKKGFAVQLGVYADSENAKLTIAKMKDAKLAVYTDSIPIKNGSATRVRVGPFTTREKADSALAQIKLAGSDGKIIPLQ